METFFKSELEKEIWISVFVRYEPDGRSSEQRMRAATALVVELREESEKLLAFGAWTRVAGEVAGVAQPAEGASVFRSDVERKIWVAAFARPLTRDVKQTAKERAKIAWERVLEFRQPQKDEKLDWSKALAELAG